MTEVELHCFENKKIQADIQSMMDEYKGLIPKWLNTLSVVSSAGDGEGNALRCHYGMHEYMHARFSVFAPYFDQSEDRRRIGLIHEHVHLQHADVLDFVEKHLIEPIRERNPDLHAFVDEEFRVKLERFTESLAIGIYKTIEAAKAKEPARESEFFRGVDLASGADASVTSIWTNPETPRDISQIAESLIKAKGATGDGKPYTGVSTIARPQKHVCAFCENALFVSELIQVSPDQWAHPECLEQHRKGHP